MKKDAAIEFRKPWLIQRCNRKDGVDLVEGQKFSDVLSLDYMGASEYEWGAVPKALRLIHSRLPLSVYEVNMNGNRVYFICKDEQLVAYSAWVMKVCRDRLNGNREDDALWNMRLKEPIGFWRAVGAEKRTNYDPKNEENLWLDLDNGVAFTLDYDVAKAFSGLIEQSIVFMDAKAVKP